MADFDVVVTGAVVAQFVDAERAPGTLGPADKGAPSRLNTTTSHPHLHFTIAPGGVVTVTAEGGASDAALGGTFTGHFAELPTGSPFPPVTFPPGFSGTQSFTLNALGHYLFVITFDKSGVASGRIAIHLDVE